MARGKQKDIVHTVENKLQNKRQQTILWPLRLSTQRKEILYQLLSHKSTAEISPLKKSGSFETKFSSWLCYTEINLAAPCLRRNPVRIEIAHPRRDQYSVIMIYWTETNTFRPVIPDGVYKNVLIWLCRLQRSPFLFTYALSLKNLLWKKCPA